MSSALRAVPAVALLAGPTVLAFFAGGYFDRPRLVAGILVWLLVGLAAATAAVAFPRARVSRLCLLGLAALTLLTGLSILWAPVRLVAQSDLERLLLYLGVLIAGTAYLRGRQGLRLAEPVLAAGALVVIGYALAGRLLPGFVHQSVSISAFGRLEQPLTYWNAVGLLAAVGTLLALRVAGDPSREGRLRAAAAGAVVPLTLGVYLTFSRGALLALGFGVVVLVVLARDRAQVRALAAFGPAVLLCIAAALAGSVRTGEGTLAHREWQGAAILVLAVGAIGVAAWAQGQLSRRADGELRLPRGAVLVGLALLAAVGFAAAATGGESGGGQPRQGADTRRLASFESNRYQYWKVAGRMFADHPVAGGGAGSFRVQWRQQRTVNDPAVDTHSLYLEVASELGLLGLLALGLFLGAGLWACVLVMRSRPQAATGAAATLAAMAIHAGLDWDWELPAVSMVALLLLAGVLALHDETAA